jgi:hypothetical protein
MFRIGAASHHTPEKIGFHAPALIGTYAAAVAAGLALGRDLIDAAARAQQYVAGAIAHAPGIGHGRGPLDHFWAGIMKG